MSELAGVRAGEDEWQSDTGRTALASDARYSAVWVEKLGSPVGLVARTLASAFLPLEDVLSDSPAEPHSPASSSLSWGGIQPTAGFGRPLRDLMSLLGLDAWPLWNLYPF